MALRELLLKLGVDVDKQGVRNADAALGNIKKAAIAAAAAFVAIKAVKAIAGMVDNVRGLGDEIDKTSQQLGLGVEALQEWRFAAGLAGVEGQEMSNSLGRLQKNAFEAAKGNKTLADDFARLGVNVKDANGELKNADTLLTEMANGFQALDNDSEKVALSLNLMGRTGRKLLPLFKDGAVGIEKMRKEAQELGGVMSQELIDASVELTDEQLRSSQAWQGIKNDIALGVLPVLIKFNKAIRPIAKFLREALGGAMKALSTIGGALIGTFEEIDNVFDLVTISLGVLGLAIVAFGALGEVAAVKFATKWALATLQFLLIAALIGLLILLVEDFIVFMKGGESVIGDAVNAFKAWISDMGGVSAAIATILSKMFQFIFGLTDGAAKKIKEKLQALFKFFAEFAPILVAQFVIAFDAVKNFIGDMVAAFTKAIDFIVEKFEAITDAVADAIDAVADAAGLGTDEAKVDKKEFRRSQRERVAANVAERSEGIAKQLAVFTKLQSEFGGTVTSEKGVTGITGVKDEAGALARLAQLQQNINAPITVNVDATGQNSPAEIADQTAEAVSNVHTNRLTQNSFVTAGG